MKIRLFVCLLLCVSAMASDRVISVHEFAQGAALEGTFMGEAFPARFYKSSALPSMSSGNNYTTTLQIQSQPSKRATQQHELTLVNLVNRTNPVVLVATDSEGESAQKFVVTLQGGQDLVLSLDKMHSRNRFYIYSANRFQAHLANISAAGAFQTSAEAMIRQPIPALAAVRAKSPNLKNHCTRKKEKYEIHGLFGSADAWFQRDGYGSQSLLNVYAPGEDDLLHEGIYFYGACSTASSYTTFRFGDTSDKKLRWYNIGNMLDGLSSSGTANCVANCNGDTAEFVITDTAN